MKTREFIDILEDYVCMSDDRELIITAEELGQLFDIEPRKCAAMLAYYRSHRDRFNNHIDVLYTPNKHKAGMWTILCPYHTCGEDIDIDGSSAYDMVTIVVFLFGMILAGIAFRWLVG